MVLKLYSYKGDIKAYKALVAAEYNGLVIEMPDFKMGKDNKTEEFLAKNPHGKVPVLDTDDGAIFESNAIARYVARQADTGLLGSNLIEMAQIESWIDFTTTELWAPQCSWLYPLIGLIPYSKQKEDAAKAAIKFAMSTFNSFLATRTFLVGHTVTLADIIAACNVLHGFTRLYDTEFRKDFPHVTRWFLTCANQP